MYLYQGCWQGMLFIKFVSSSNYSMDSSLCSLSALVCVSSGFNHLSRNWLEQFCTIPNSFVALAIMFVTTKCESPSLFCCMGIYNVSSIYQQLPRYVSTIISPCLFKPMKLRRLNARKSIRISGSIVSLVLLAYSLQLHFMSDEPNDPLVWSSSLIWRSGYHRVWLGTRASDSVVLPLGNNIKVHRGRLMVREDEERP